MEIVQFEALNLLLKAPSKDVVVRLCNEVHLQQNPKHWPEPVVKYASQALSSSNAESKMMLSALRTLVKNAIFKSLSSPSEVSSLFPSDFHKSLAELLAKILSERLPQWKLHAANNLVFLPQLVDFDWRVDIKTSSDSLSRMSVPTCFLQLQVQEPASEVGIMPPVSSVNVELSRETLDTMLDGLGKIRDQLSSVANK
jgi:COMM domain containing 9